MDLRRIDFCQSANVLAITGADNVFSVGLFGLGENICVWRSVLLCPVQNPVCFSRISGGNTTVSLNGPTTVCVLAGACSLQEVRNSFRNGLSLHDSCLLVEDPILFDQVRIGIADYPAVPATRSLFRLFIADNCTERCYLASFDAIELDALSCYTNAVNLKIFYVFVINIIF